MTKPGKSLGFRLWRVLRHFETRTPFPIIRSRVPVRAPPVPPALDTRIDSASNVRIDSAANVRITS